jgi:hypothetical protein
LLRGMRGSRSNSTGGPGGDMGANGEALGDNPNVWAILMETVRNGTAGIASH